VTWSKVTLNIAALPLLVATVLELDDVLLCVDGVRKTPTAAAPTIRTATMVSSNADVRFVLVSGLLKEVKLCVARWRYSQLFLLELG
jgi:hypothetical protein